MATLKQLNALVALGQTRSFTRAASRLSLTQSAVSVMIRGLEEELGTALVERGKQICLTEAGEALSACASRSIDEIDRALDEIRGGVFVKRSRLRLAVAHLSAATYFPSVLANFVRRCPNITVEVHDCPVERVSQLLISQEVDAGIGSLTAEPTLATLLGADLLLQGELWAVFPATGTHALAAESRAHLDWNQMQGLALILVGRVTGQWRGLLAQLAEAQVEVRVTYEVSLHSTALEMVKQGLGATLLPGFAIPYLDSRAFAAYPLRKPVTAWPVHWLQRRHGIGSAAAGLMHEMVKSALVSPPAPEMVGPSDFPG